MFDWGRFLNVHSIEFVERGPSTARGNIYVKCPFCGEADQGHHLGISLESKGWGCWKNSAHRGRSPQRLIQALLKCSWADAARLAGIAPSGLQIGSGGILAAVQSALGIGAIESQQKPLTFPSEFRPLSLTSNAQIVNEYLQFGRNPGYSADDILALSEKFNLHYAMTGDWSYRLIVPVYDEQTRLATWSGRAIVDQVKVRYKTLTASAEKAGDGPLALGPITDYLLGLPDLFHGGSFLVLGEGPFDAFRLALAADDFEAKATCLFGKVVSAAQLDLLALLRPAYDAIFLLLDPDAALSSLAVSSQMNALGIIRVPLSGDDDPDEMSKQQLKKLFIHMEARAQAMRR